MAKARSSDTKARIRAVATELFAKQGVKQTSLREIADQLGMTKAALYYHFDSREALVLSIIQPLFDDLDVFIVERERTASHDPRELLGDYFDLMYLHRDVLGMIVRDFGTLIDLDLVARMLEWRHRLMRLLIGPEPSLADRARAVVAIGGISDCAIEFEDAPAAEVKGPALEAALAALDLQARKP